MGALGTLGQQQQSDSSSEEAERHLRLWVLAPSLTQFDQPSESYWLNRKKSDRISIVDVVFGRERERSEATVRQGEVLEYQD